MTIFRGVNNVSSSASLTRDPVAQWSSVHARHVDHSFGRLAAVTERISLRNIRGFLCLSVCVQFTSAMTAG